MKPLQRHKAKGYRDCGELSETHHCSVGTTRLGTALFRGPDYFGVECHTVNFCKGVTGCSQLRTCVRACVGGSCLGFVF